MKKIADGAVTASKLDPSTGNQFIRAASASADKPALVGPDANGIIASTTIDAPRPGFLHILNTAAATTDDHNDNCATNVTVQVQPGTHTVGLDISGNDGA